MNFINYEYYTLFDFLYKIINTKINNKKIIIDNI